MFQEKVGFCGSRNLNKGLSPLAPLVVSEVLRSASLVAVGCCIGSDSFVLNSVISQGAVARCSVFAAFGEGGQGACSLSAVSLVSAFSRGGGSVRWWAGGGVGVPLRVRLATRSKVLISSVSALIAFVSSPSLSSGSWLSVAGAVRRGLPVVVFPVGFGGGSLPVLGSGGWVSAGSGVWSSGFRWVSEARQELLF